MVKSHNEWDTLKEVYVGIIDNPNNPDHDRDLHCINYADREEMLGVKEGLYPKQVIEETQEDLEGLVSILKSLGVKVKRPQPQDNQSHFATLDWCTNGYYNYCPRDSVVVIGDTIIESPMALRSRYFETFSFRDEFIDYMKIFFIFFMFIQKSHCTCIISSNFRIQKCKFSIFFIVK